MIQLRDRIPPASWTIVMACGVLSIDLSAVHQPALSTFLLWFTAGVWLLLVAVLGVPLVDQRDRTVRSPVALAGLALLSATLAGAFRAGWLVAPAALFLLLALALYGFTLSRFDLRQLISGQGDHWIAGGALAIAALSAGKVAEAARTLDRLRHLQQILGPSTFVLWCLAMAWLPVLLVSEVVRPRLGYDVRRWATVFPFGMYAVCSFTVGQVTGVSGIISFGRVWTWVASAVALVVFAGLFRHIHQAWRPKQTAAAGALSTSRKGQYDEP
jgi:tellurite resistance protein TehA-like permease